jgi:hypothetical protein
MNSGHEEDNILPPRDWPPKDVIFSHLFSYSPASAIVMSAVSRYWNNLFKERQFWDQVLRRDYSFTLDALKSLEPSILKKIYIVLANLEKNNPAFAKWYQKNVIATGADFSILYKTVSDIEFTSWLDRDVEFNLALRVSNFDIAKQLLFEKFANDDPEPNDETLTEMAEFGNSKAVQWLHTVAGVRLADAITDDTDTDSDSDSDSDLEEAYDLIKKLKQEKIVEVEELGELSELADEVDEEQKETAEKPAAEPSKTLLEFALISPNLELIQSEISKSSPEEVLRVCQDVIAEEKDSELPFGLCLHAPEIAKLLIAPCIIAFQRKNASFEQARALLYPLAAFSGKIDTFTWLNQELIQKFKSSQAHQDLLTESGDPTLIIALLSGKLDLVKWLISPEGGKLKDADSQAFAFNNLGQVMKSRNTELVTWFISQGVVDLKMETAEDLHNIMRQLAMYPELTKLLKEFLELSKEGAIPVLSDNQLKEIFYIAAENNNISAVSLLLDPTIGNVVLSAENKSVLMHRLINSDSVPMLEFLSHDERGEKKLILTPEFLSQSIKSLPSIFHDQNNLPALIHWLTSDKHGKLPVSENDVNDVNHIRPRSEITKNLIQGILERAVIAQNKSDHSLNL